MIASAQRVESAPAFRRRFRLAEGHGRLVSAQLSATALGIVELFLNGAPVSEDVLTPGWSSYEWRLRYAEWDVLPLVHADSVLGAVVGAGWHSGRLGFAGERAVYGDVRALWARLVLTFEDGFVQQVVTDESWQSGPSPSLLDDLYDGQTIDARARENAWMRPGDEPRGWGGVVTVDVDQTRLTPYIAPPVRRQEHLEPVRVWTSPAGATLVDFGQNLVGWTHLTVRGRRGAEIVLRHAEVLEHEEIGVRPLRTARATDRYVLSGGVDVFEPTLTFHGFRYVEVTGWPGSHDELAAALQAVVIGSDLRRIGTFECSDPLLNRLHENIVWSMRGNFVDVPTDCPQRDERLGWTGDLAAFVDTAVYLFDVGDFLRDWLADLAVEQEAAGGTIPLVVPDNFKYENRAGLTAAMNQLEFPVAALWHDAAIWVPWAAWRAYGDRAALIAEYPSMAAYARRISQALDADGILRGVQLGDWLDPDAPAGQPWMAKADPYVVATACVHRSARMAAEAATVLGEHRDAAEFGALAARIRRAFNDEFVHEGRITSDATTAYALAIAFDLLDESDRRVAGERLAELVRDAGYHVTTGFAGTPFIVGALSDTGHLDDAYRLVQQTECPSWLFPVTMGATTIWERWDSMLPDGSINPGEMTSFNHYAFGAVGEWLHRVVAGVSALEPGYRKVLFAPRPGGGITWAATRLTTPQGDVRVRWQETDDRLEAELEIPEGATAVVRLPGLSERTVSAGTHRVTVPRQQPV